MTMRSLVSLNLLPLLLVSLGTANLARAVTNTTPIIDSPTEPTELTFEETIHELNRKFESISVQILDFETRVDQFQNDLDEETKKVLTVLEPKKNKLLRSALSAFNFLSTPHYEHYTREKDDIANVFLKDIHNDLEEISKIKNILTHPTSDSLEGEYEEGQKALIKLQVLPEVGYLTKSLLKSLTRQIQFVENPKQKRDGFYINAHVIAVNSIFGEMKDSLKQIQEELRPLVTNILLKALLKGDRSVQLCSDLTPPQSPSTQTVPTDSLRLPANLSRLKTQHMVHKRSCPSAKVTSTKSFDVKIKKRGNSFSQSSSNEVICEPFVQLDARDLLQLGRNHAEVFYTIFSNSKNIRMDRFEAAWTSIPGCTIEERAGSAIAFIYRGTRVFLLHRPHPQPTMYPALVKRAKVALEAFGITETLLDSI